MILWRYGFIAGCLSLSLVGDPVRVRLPYKELVAVNSSFGSDLACPEIQALVMEIQKELGMADYQIEVRKFSEKGLEYKTPGMAVLRTHVFFDEEQLLQMSRDEQRFLIGHELVHIRGNHRRKKNILNNVISYGGTALSLVVAGALYKQMVSAQQVVFDDEAYVKNRYAQLSDLCKQATLFTQNQALGASLVVYFSGAFASTFLGECAEKTLSRSHEEEADCYAAHELNCALGGCLFFLKSMLVSGDFSKESGFLNTHPTDFQRFMNMILISGDQALYDLLADEQDTKSGEQYFKDIQDYLEAHVSK